MRHLYIKALRVQRSTEHGKDIGAVGLSPLPISHATTRSLTKHTLISVWTFGISEADFGSLNAKHIDAAAYVANDSDNKNSTKSYMGTFEAVHQLHCLVSAPCLLGKIPALLWHRCLPCL